MYRLIQALFREGKRPRNTLKHFSIIFLVLFYYFQYIKTKTRDRIDLFLDLFSEVLGR